MTDKPMTVGELTIGHIIEELSKYPKETFICLWSDDIEGKNQFQIEDAKYSMADKTVWLEFSYNDS